MDCDVWIFWRFFSSYKKGSIIVEASSEYSAKDIAKKVIINSYKHVTILSAKKCDSKGRPIKTDAPLIAVLDKRSSHTSNLTSYRKLSPEEIRQRKLKIIEKELKLKEKKNQRAIKSKERQIKKC